MVYRASFAIGSECWGGTTGVVSTPYQIWLSSSALAEITSTDGSACTVERPRAVAVDYGTCFMRMMIWPKERCFGFTLAAAVTRGPD